MEYIICDWDNFYLSVGRVAATYAGFIHFAA